MKEAMPALQHSIKGLSKINRVDLDEIKSLNHPTDIIVNLMTAVCIILRIEPIQRKSDGKTHKDYWLPAIGK